MNWRRFFKAVIGTWVVLGSMFGVLIGLIYVGETCGAGYGWLLFFLITSLLIGFAEGRSE